MWGMFAAADWVVKAVMIGLVVASVLTWTVFVGQEPGARDGGAASAPPAGGGRRCGVARQGAVERAWWRRPRPSSGCSADTVDDRDGLKERVASRLERIEAATGRRMLKGHRRAGDHRLDGAVRGPVRHGVGHHELLHRHLEVADDQPRGGGAGIAEALLATALGLAAAIPAVVIYNHFARQVSPATGRWSATRRPPCCGWSRAIWDGGSRCRSSSTTAATSSPENHEINVTPFIDVMLVLLIIFMVAAPLATVDVPVDLPASTAERQPKPETPLFLTLKGDLSFMLEGHAGEPRGVSPKRSTR